MENNKEVFESIFKRNLWDADTQSYLENIAGEYPYFAPAQFYLLLQTKKDKASYSKQVKKTAVLFNNNYWLNYLLTTTYKPALAFIQPDFEPEETIANTTAAVIHTNNETVVEEMENTEASVVYSPLKDNVANNVTTDDNSIIEESSFAKEAVELNEPITVNEEEAIDGNKFITEVPVVEEAKINELTAITAESASSFNSKAIEDNIVQSEFTTQTVEQPSVLPEKELIQNTRGEGLTTVANPPDAVENKKDIEDASSETLLFQPLYTSDYFASVGIKLSEEANSSDRLGKQLKSFTQWLKTMKKIDPRNAAPLLPSEIGSENVDSNIQTLAEKSNKDDEIITEAMADVLVQQGRINKAVEVLKKLSLLNPSKSTYFAAKIEQLKD